MKSSYFVINHSVLLCPNLYSTNIHISLTTCSILVLVRVVPTAPSFESESESYVTTDSQSASLSWNKAPNWGLRPDFYYCQTVQVCCGGRSLWREDGCAVYNCCWSSPAQSFLRLSPADSWPYFTVSYSPRNRVALGSLFVASYNSQGYGGGIRTRLHAGYLTYS
jgi:hypothetical protein